MAVRLLVCGDRNWNDAKAVLTEINRIQPDIVIHGGAAGADYFAGLAASALRIPVQEYKAQWTTYGRAAGPIRNRQMLDEGQPTMVLAFHDDLSKSKGTKNMVAQAEKAGLPVTVFSHPQE